MARIVGINLVLISSAILLLSSRIPISLCDKKPAFARKEDVPFIKCQVCGALAYQLLQKVEEKQAKFSPKKVREYDIIETLEGICNLKKLESDWIPYLDIIELGDTLRLILQDSEGQCNSKCKTIERACQEVLGNHDTDIAEYIYKSKPDFESLLNFLCHDLTKSCTSPPPPVPKDRVPGDPFVRKSSKESKIDRRIKALEDMPETQNVKFYSTEDLKKGKYDTEDADDDDDDDEYVDEREFALKWKKKMAKEKKMEDIKEKRKSSTTKKNIETHNPEL